MYNYDDVITVEKSLNRRGRRAGSDECPYDKTLCVQADKILANE